MRNPDVVINGNGNSTALFPTKTADVRFPTSRFNHQDTLLSGLVPYNYGRGSRVSDDISYQTTPHKIQKIIPQIFLPSAVSAFGPDDILLSHGVDDGDLAFTIRMVHNNPTCMKDFDFFAKQKIPRTVDPIVNIATVNYILRGLQTDMGENATNWKSFLRSTGWPMHEDTYGFHEFKGGPYQYRNVSMFVQDYIRPLGVVIGSDRQGGQHQGGQGGKGVDFPVDYTVTMLVDGVCDNMLNLWQRTEIRAGDDLMLALCGCAMVDHAMQQEHSDVDINVQKGPLGPHFSAGEGGPGVNASMYAPVLADTTYVLNHWAQGTVKAMFSNHPNLLYELVPTTSSEIDEGYFLGDDRRNRGLWHIARSQAHARGVVGGVSMASATKLSMQTFRNDHVNLMAGGGIIQATIAPVWKSASPSFQGTMSRSTIAHATHGITPLETRSTVHHPPHRLGSLLGGVTTNALMIMLGASIVSTESLSQEEVGRAQDIMKFASKSLQSIENVLTLAHNDEWDEVESVFVGLAHSSTGYYSSSEKDTPAYVDLVCTHEIEKLYQDSLEKNAIREVVGVVSVSEDKRTRSAYKINAFPFICACYVYFACKGNSEIFKPGTLIPHIKSFMTEHSNGNVHPMSDAVMCAELKWCIDTLPYSTDDAYDMMVGGTFDYSNGNGVSDIDHVRAILNDTWPRNSIANITAQIALLHAFLDEQVVGKEENLYQSAKKTMECLCHKLTEFQQQQPTKLTSNSLYETGVVNAHVTIARHIVQQHKALMVAIP